MQQESFYKTKLEDSLAALSRYMQRKLTDEEKKDQSEIITWYSIQDEKSHYCINCSEHIAAMLYFVTKRLLEDEDFYEQMVVEIDDYFGFCDCDTV